METSSVLWVICFVFIIKTEGLSNNLVDSPCGDWIPYRNEKCIKLVAQAGLRGKQDGESTCNAFAQKLQDDEIPKLLTIKTEEEQHFLQNLLFEDLATVDNIWLGSELEKNDTFLWNDGTNLFFTNWVEEKTSENEHSCVQMQSGEGAYEVGKWLRADCRKRNAVVCERPQRMSSAALQNILLNLKEEVAKNKRESDQKLNDAKDESAKMLHYAQKECDMKLNDAKKEAKQNLNESHQKINEAYWKISEAFQNISRANQEIAVPIGFIYIQLPLQDNPAALWPHTTWKNIGADYAGLFFRVEGGNAAPFGELQQDNTRRVADLQTHYTEEDCKPQVPSDGSWCKYSWSGTNAPGTKIGVRVRLTKGEVRPRNKAVKLWQRIK